MATSGKSGDDARQHLRALPTPDDRGAESAPARRGRGRLSVLLAAALVLAIAGLVLEARRAARLELEVTALTEGLREARTALEAQRQRRAEARQHVSDLRGRVEILDALLAEDPAPPASR